MTDNAQRQADKKTAEAASVKLGLNAAIVSVQKCHPKILLVKDKGTDEEVGLDSLPYGPFTPLEHRTLEIGLRNWVTQQTGLDLGYVEQLYTFGDRGRHAKKSDRLPHIVSIGYLALTGIQDETTIGQGSQWRSWYYFMPWEDWRNGKPAILKDDIEPRLKQWAEREPSSVSSARPIMRKDRIRICFGLDGVPWDEEKVLERYELLYEAGLLAEARLDGRKAVESWQEGELAVLGQPLQFDHRRILATAMGRLRGKLKYRPVVFELMPTMFTLLQLQLVIEAITGTRLHKQNFRRLVEASGLVEKTGETSTNTGGRPAKLFRFRPDALLERPEPGLRV